MNTRVLFNWQPRSLDLLLHERLRKRLLKSGWFTHPRLIQTRGPNVNRALLPEIKEWHQDEAGRGTKFIVWSNRHPTEVRFPDGSLLDTRDGDVILIDNDEVEHRAPDFPAYVDRWLVRTGPILNTAEL